jgi:hypothetical protein
MPDSLDTDHVILGYDSAGPNHKEITMASDAESEVIVAVFADPLEARECIEDLHRAGYADGEIGIAAPRDQALDRELVIEHSRVAEGSVAGAVTGAGLGTLWGIAMAAGLLPSSAV